MTHWSADKAVPVALIGLLMLLEAYANRQRRAGVASRDRGSLLAVVLLVGGGYWAAFAFWYGAPPPPRLGVSALWAGAAVALSGMALRLWAVATLGRYFTYTVKVSPDQKVVDNGPYHLLRHPSYTGALLMALGIGLSLRYAWAPLLIAGPSLVGYLIRIRVEERALAEGIGAHYRYYMERTKRLIPFVW
ncbi:isoprenylcysteine carboxylmethyltransferase family protein [Phenylobacterium sp.]|uniref:methyltransferase family protein n=1 Tax=Phenylobacterium sp. TaxID=1871053 RepID=UPI0012218173|nr:isoprenylcysteine carboxylmethyltransferase family protein [Phenylobacterium sp.]THD64729.1 MAG: isoprenylcysteine carboxylmethyltransferase family protein [Phenylobacterium sp.]